ncbi:9900_t:CDS:2, partial [Racocetra fulgida]
NSDIKILIECFRQDLKDCYKSLATKIRETNAYEVVLLDEYLPQNKYERYNFIQNLQLDSTIMLYRYYHSNYLGTLNFIWCIPLDPNERSDNLQAKIIIEIQEKLPHYFTRTKFDIFWDEVSAYFEEVQARQLRKSHPDAHYCRAIFKYFRHFAVKFKEHTALIFADDKHKVPIGEDVATSTGVRNKSVAIPISAILNASDHDFTKLSLTPSVMLLATIPEEPTDSFYNGQ